jgi:hypothetical protein
MAIPFNTTGLQGVAMSKDSQTKKREAKRDPCCHSAVLLN